MTAFLHFVQMKKDVYKEKFPELSYKQITSKLGSEWKEMVEEEKKPYEEKAKVDKERYDKDKECYYNLKKQQTEEEVKKQTDLYF